MKAKEQAAVEERDPKYFAKQHPGQKTLDLKKQVAEVWNCAELSKAAAYCAKDENACVYVSCSTIGRTQLHSALSSGYSRLEAVVALTKGNTRLKWEDMTRGPLASLLKETD